MLKMHDYDDDDDINIIIHLKTEMIPIITGETRTSPQPSKICMRDSAIYGQLN